MQKATVQILKTQHERPTMETAGLYVKPLMHEWGTVNFGGRVSARLTFCQNTISKRSHWLSLKNAIRPRSLPYCVIIPTWNVCTVSGSCMKSEQLPIFGWHLWTVWHSFIILLLWRLNHRFLIMVKIWSDAVKTLKGLSMPGWGFNDQISLSLIG